MSGLIQSTYIVESADHLDFYTYAGEDGKYVHGSAPLGTETIHGVYRSPIGGNFIQYARTHLEKVSAAIVEEGVGLLKIKFSELAKDPEAAGVKIFGETGLGYVPDMSVSFDNSGSIHGFSGSLETEIGEVKVEALIRSEDVLPITVPTNAVECEHSNPYLDFFEDEQGGGHYHHCIQCHSVFDYGHHEYHEGDEHCHVCDYVETVEASLKEGVVLPETLSGLKVLESKTTGNFLSIEGVPGIFHGTSSTPLAGNYHVEYETWIKDGEDSYYVLAEGTQLDGQAGCLYPMHWVVSYTKYVGDERGTPVVIYEKTSMLEYHETQPKKVDGMGDACHVYSVEECQICHQEYGFPELKVNHDPKMKENQDGSYTVTCAKCNESAILEIVDFVPEDETGHKVAYNYVSGSREIYEFFEERNSLQDHDYVYKDGVGTCTVCGYETTRKQVVVDLSSYVGEEAKITLFLDKDRGQQAIAKASTSLVMQVDAVDPDTEQTRSGYALVSHPDVFVAVEPVETHVPETTCQYTVEWQIGIYRVQYDEQTEQFVLDGELLDTCEDPWDPAQIQNHAKTHGEFTRQGDSCVYDCRYVCDACGETAYEFEASFHKINIVNEGDGYRVSCENCHESALVGNYYWDTIDAYYHALRATGEITNASSEGFMSEVKEGLLCFHAYDAEGNCVCGDHREDKMTDYVWAHNLFSEDPIDVAGGVHITRDEAGNATAAELYGQGEQSGHNVGSNYEEWNYQAVDSNGNAIGLIHVEKDFVPYEDHLVMSEHSFSLSLDGIEGDVSNYALIDHDAQTPDYKTFGVLIAYELSGESEGVAGRINFQYEVKEGSKMLSGISYEGVGAAIPSLTKIDQLEGEQRIDIKAFQIVDTEGNGLNYCFISKEYQHLEGEDWMEHETHYFIADFDPDNPASDISLMALREVAFH